VLYQDDSRLLRRVGHDLRYLSGGPGGLKRFLEHVVVTLELVIFFLDRGRLVAQQAVVVLAFLHAGVQIIDLLRRFGGGDLVPLVMAVSEVSADYGKNQEDDQSTQHDEFTFGRSAARVWRSAFDTARVPGRLPIRRRLATMPR